MGFQMKQAAKTKKPAAMTMAELHAARKARKAEAEKAAEERKTYASKT